MEHPPESRPPKICFTPAILKARHDGWNPDRQRRFIAALAATRLITAACATVGMSRATAYCLRARPEAASFAQAWDTALAFDPAAPRPHSPRALQRQARSTARSAKADKRDETHDPPDSFIPAPLARHVRHLRQFRHLRESARGPAPSGVEG